jgi:hypothetical protein
MATRASITFTVKGKPMFAMYKHWDGYPKGLGKKLEEIVKAGTMTNGLGQDRTLGAVFNGPGCLFATVIAKLKQEPGDVYICDIESVGKQGEDYVYEMNEKGGIGWAEIS